MKHAQSHLYLHCFEIHNRIMLKMMLFWLYTVYVAFVICSPSVVRIKSFTTCILSYCFFFNIDLAQFFKLFAFWELLPANCHMKTFPQNYHQPSERQTVCIEIRLDFMSGLISV